MWCPFAVQTFISNDQSRTHTLRKAGARPTEREQIWLDHLRACRRLGQTVKAYAMAHGLSVSALYTARSKPSLAYRSLWRFSG